MSDRIFLAFAVIAILAFVLLMGHDNRQKHLQECAIRRTYARTAFDSMTYEIKCAPPSQEAGKP